MVPNQVSMLSFFLNKNIKSDSVAFLISGLSVFLIGRMENNQEKNRLKEAGKIYHLVQDILTLS